MAVKCQHCGREITRTVYGTWQDSSEWEVCTLSPDTGPSHSPLPSRTYDDTMYALRKMAKAQLHQFARAIVADESVPYESIQSAIDKAEE